MRDVTREEAKEAFASVFDLAEDFYGERLRLWYQSERTRWPSERGYQVPVCWADTNRWVTLFQGCTGRDLCAFEFVTQALQHYPAWPHEVLTPSTFLNWADRAMPFDERLLQEVNCIKGYLREARSWRDDQGEAAVRAMTKLDFNRLFMRCESLRRGWQCDWTPRDAIIPRWAAHPARWCVYYSVYEAILPWEVRQAIRYCREMRVQVEQGLVKYEGINGWVPQEPGAAGSGGVGQENTITVPPLATAVSQ